jgi:tripartite-type tricarboxylate transporter receptor subunit TctC
LDRRRRALHPVANGSIRAAIEPAHQSAAGGGEAMSRRSALAALLAVALLAPVAAGAQPSFKGKTVYLDIGPGTAGGGYDIAGRFLARHLAKHLPGNPTIVPQNVEGGSGLVLANQLYSAGAPRDGTVVGMIADNAILTELLGVQGVRYHVADYSWIGRIATAVDLTVTWYSAKAKTIDDAKKDTVLIAAGPQSGLAYQLPALVNAVVGTKFKLITGYNGVIPMQLAMEKGETDGAFAEWTAFQIVHGDWLRDKKINFLVQYALERDPDMPNVPTAIDLGRTEADKQLLALGSAGASIGRTLLAPPGLPADVLKVWRDGFDEAMHDPELLAEANQLKLFIAPLRGEALQELVTKLVKTPPAVLARAKQILSSK